MTPTLDEIRAAFDGGDHERVLRLTDEALAEHPGDDAAHEYRARALLALGRPAAAERHATDAVRLDPEEVRYRELLAQTLSAAGAHRDAAAEYERLARKDPRQTAWTLAEAEERLGADQARLGADAARRAVRLAPGDGRAQLALSHALARTGDTRGALQAAARATDLLPNDLAAREALADAQWLNDDGPAAFAEYGALARALGGSDRGRLVRKARSLYRQRSGMVGRLLAAIPGLFSLALGRDWIHVDR